MAVREQKASPGFLSGIASHAGRQVCFDIFDDGDSTAGGLKGSLDLSLKLKKGSDMGGQT